MKAAMTEYKKCSYNIKAEKMTPGTSIYNFFEDCHYTTDDNKCIKLIGTAGEEWPVTIEKLASTYTLLDGTTITKDNIPDGVFEITTIVDENEETVFAEQITEKIQVTTSSGEVLTANREGIPHGSGDFIVYANKNGNPNLDDKWVVNGEIFLKTYQKVQ